MDAKALRKMTGLSIAAFSKKYGVPVDTFRNWEYRRPSSTKYGLYLLHRAVIGDINVEADVPKMTVKELRERTELTQTEFGEKYHIKFATVQNWEYERVKISDWILKLLTLAVIKDFPN